MIPNLTVWNVDEITLYLPQYKAQSMKLVLSADQLENELVWLFEKSRNYSTKSGYYLEKIHNGNQQGPFNLKHYV